MTPQEMSQLLQAELNKREKKKTAGLSREQLAEIYRQARAEKAERDIDEKPRRSLKLNKKHLAALFLIGAGALSLFYKPEITPEPLEVAPQPELWSEADVLVLTQLDQRRAELDRREEAIRASEAELAEQSALLDEKIAELSLLTSKMEQRSEAQKERLEQLAEVYGSMAPQDAAPLIAQLEDDLALGMLERMPKKRMGQILSLMAPQRALELTKGLTR